MSRKKILIADDDRVMHALCVEGLGEGYEYLHAYNGVETLVLAVDHVPDLILLDIMMPILDGRTVCKTLKNYPKTKASKIVMISGRDAQADRILGFEVGADDYFEKPVTLPMLSRAVENLLR